MTNGNNNMSQNNQAVQNFDSLKALKSTTVKEANTLLSDVREIKKRITGISQAVEQKQKLFAEQVKAAQEDELKKPQPEVLPAEKPEEKVSKPVVEQQPVQQENKEEVKQEEKKSSVKIEITRVQPLISTPQQNEPKIFIDEKGNKIVRKFITDRFPPKKPQPAAPQQRINFNQPRPQSGNKNFGGKPFDQNKPRQQFGANKPFGDKDQDSANKFNQNRQAAKPKVFSEVCQKNRKVNLSAIKIKLLKSLNPKNNFRQNRCLKKVISIKAA